MKSSEFKFPSTIMFVFVENMEKIKCNSQYTRGS